MAEETVLDDGGEEEKPVGKAAETPPEQAPSPAPSPAETPAPTGEIPAPIIVKKITIEGGGHHGGAWKVAYADFVTAMMAFFLLLWLLGATTEDQRKGLADHFTPTLINYREGSAGADGVLGGSSINEVDNYPNRQGQTGAKAITVPRGARGGPDTSDNRALDEAAALAQAKAEMERKALKETIEERLNAQERLKKIARQVRVVNTPKGIRIDLVDDADFSMFTIGTTVLVPDARAIVQIVAEAIGDNGQTIVVRGHTDALKWKPGVPSNNWSLSSGRAEATRQALMRSGISEERFSRIEGVAARELLIPDNPTDPRNRRVSIVLEDRQANGFAVAAAQ
jgi:chemotaxis protein MotB